MATQEADFSARALKGFKYLDRLLPLVERLHDVGCTRDRAGNRQLHYDQYCLLVLLALFNPVVRSLRAIQQASTLRKVQKVLGCPRTSLGALSEATAVFDAQRLEGIVGELLQEVPRARSIGGDKVPQVLTAVDGSIVRTLASLAEAAYLTDKNGQPHCGWRFHTHFEIDRGVPVRIDVTTAHNSGKTDEKQQLRNRLQADRCYVMDRWFGEFALFIRFFKHVLGCRHLISQDPGGIQIQAYCAIIACLLIHLWTGGRPTLRSYEMICFYLSGWADLDELTAHLEKLADTKKPN